ncbi:MAG TPA: hypothetical protein VE198_06515 [Actinoallomurus sp.]|nr:hypothetical protein [Actinoallomurus sp.]
MCSDNRTIDLERAALVLLGGVQVTVIASITLITVALPEIRRDLGRGRAGPGARPSAYGLSFGGLLLLGGRLADLFGRRGTLVAGMTVFGAAAACGRPAVRRRPDRLARDGNDRTFHRKGRTRDRRRLRHRPGHRTGVRP